MKKSIPANVYFFCVYEWKEIVFYLTKNYQDPLALIERIIFRFSSLDLAGLIIV
jgi:hypothetical protein